MLKGVQLYGCLVLGYVEKSGSCSDQSDGPETTFPYKLTSYSDQRTIHSTYVSMLATDKILAIQCIRLDVLTPKHTHSVHWIFAIQCSTAMQCRHYYLLLYFF